MTGSNNKGTISAVIMGSRQRRKFVVDGINWRVMSAAMLHKYFDIDWKYSIDQSEYSKAEAYVVWKRGLCDN